MRLLIATLFLCSLSAPACSLFGTQPEDPYWEEYELQNGPPLRDLLHACEWAVNRAGFPPGETDVVGATVTSGWDRNLAVYSNQGYRSQAVIELHPGTADGNYQVRVRVHVQINKEVHKTLDPAAAQWEDAREDPARARVVLEQLLAQVAPRGVHSDRRRKMR